MVAVTPALDADYITVADKAAINIVSFNASPSQVSVGQSVQVIMTVSNEGAGGAINVLPNDPDPNKIALLGSGNANWNSGPNPASAPVLPSLIYEEFTWTYFASNPGTIWFSNGALGEDTGSGLPIYATAAWSNTVLVQSVASLTSGTTILPVTQASVGQQLTVIISVTNSGDADASYAWGVTTQASGAGSVVWAGGWPTAVTITGGTSAHFTWTFSADGASLVHLEGREGAPR